MALLATPSQSQFSPLLGVGSRSDGGRPTEPPARSLAQGGRHRHSIPRGRRRRRGRDSKRGRRLRAKLVSPPLPAPSFPASSFVSATHSPLAARKEKLVQCRRRGARERAAATMNASSVETPVSFQVANASHLLLSAADRNSMLGLLDIYSELILPLSNTFLPLQATRREGHDLDSASSCVEGPDQRPKCRANGRRAPRRPTLRPPPVVGPLRRPATTRQPCFVSINLILDIIRRYLLCSRQPFLTPLSSLPFPFPPVENEGRRRERGRRNYFERASE